MLNNDQKRRGVVAPTAGNHGIGLSYAANKLGIPVHIFLPENTDPMKIGVLPGVYCKIKTNSVKRLTLLLTDP